MKITGSILVEDISNTGSLRGSWRSPQVEIVAPESRAEAHILLHKNKTPVHIPLASGLSRVITARWESGMMTLMCSRPRCQILMSKLDVSMLKEFAVLAAQYAPGATPQAREQAAEVLRRRLKREREESERKENVYNARLAIEDARDPKKSRVAQSSIFLTRGSGNVQLPPRAPLAPVSGAARLGHNHAFGPVTPQRAGGPASAKASLSPNSNAMFASSSSSTSNGFGAGSVSSAVQSGLAAGARPALNWRAVLGDAAADTLSAQQQLVLDRVAEGSSVYFTGSAGTGKSHLLQAVAKLLNSSAGTPPPSRGGGSAGPARRAFFTSTTGVTAVHIGGTTLLHWAGLGAAQREPGVSVKDYISAAVARVRRTPDTEARWRRTEVLVIDEASMMSAQLFSLLEAVARAIRGNNAPFGGIQLVVCGDFFQLPPVSRGGTGSGGFHDGGASAQMACSDQELESAFAFEAPAWGACFPPERTVLLARVYRQRDDTFADALHAVREGDCGDEVMRVLRPAMERGGRLLAARKRGGYSGSANDAAGDYEEGASATWLLTRKHEVDARNASQLARLTGDTVTMRARDVGRTELLDKATPVRAAIDLKVGAQVLLMKNVSVAEGLCNGTRGQVTAFNTQDEPIVYFPSANKTILVARETWSVRLGTVVEATREQVPLELAWAVSVHKSQGMSLDQAVVSLNSVFEYGQAYVALSRVRSLQGLYLIGFDPSAVRAHPRVLAYYRTLHEAEMKRRDAAAAKERRRLNFRDSGSDDDCDDLDF